MTAGMYVKSCGKINIVDNSVVRKDGTLTAGYPSQTSDADNYEGNWQLTSTSVDYDVRACQVRVCAL